MNRRVIALLVVGCLVVGIVGVFGRDLVRDLVSGTLGDPAEQEARPLSADEAQRLASMRQHNWDDARAGIRAAIGDPAQEVHAVGWVDWQRPLVYLAISGDQRAGVVTELVQAVPGLVATRPGPGAGTGDSDDAETGADPTPTAPTTPDQAPPDPTTSGPETIDPHPPPPLEPPAGDWQVRHPDGGPIDTLVALLFKVAADAPDSADILASSDSQWLRQDRTAGHEVDVLLGPAIPPSAAPDPTAAPPSPPASGPPSPLPTASPTPTPTPAAGTPSPSPVGAGEHRSLADMGGAVQYWLDGDGRLHRMEALLAADVPVRVDLDRADRAEPVAVDLLGGAATDPRPVTDEEAQTLSELRERGAAAGGGEVTVTLPGEETVRAVGWLDWQRMVAYLSVSGVDLGPLPDPDAPDDPDADIPDDSDADPADGGGTAGPIDALLLADFQGVAVLPQEPGSGDESATDQAASGAAGSEPPPLPIPQEESWLFAPWEGRGDEHGGFDLDLLLNEALAPGGEVIEDVTAVRDTAVWLREDDLSGTPVAVYEIPREIEAEVAMGEAKLRYWVDEDGLLRRLEIRTRSGGFGQLDVTPTQVPSLQ